MGHAKRAVEREEVGSGEPLKVLQAAYDQTRVPGSSTALVIVLAKSGLCAANVGDSGFYVLRDGAVFFRSPSQQHGFNFPYQLGGGQSDRPRDAQLFRLPVRPGDVVVAATDGVLDNVFDEDLTTTVNTALAQGLGPETAARRLAQLARDKSNDQVGLSPFAMAARDAGYWYRGGKLDDVTVVVSLVRPRREADALRAT